MSYKHKSIILFDGICGLCNRFVRFVIKRDLNNKFLFASLQSNFAKTILQNHGHPTDKLDTLILVNNYQESSEKIFFKAQGALLILKHLGGFWKIFYGFIIFPDFILNFFYKLVANNRYKIFGKYDSCPLPDPNIQSKFIDL